MNTKRDHLVNHIKNLDNKELVYNTACLHVTEGNQFEAVYKEMMAFVERTTIENGCIEFFIVPGDIEQKEIFLWEVWENKSAFDNHMTEEHTATFLGKGLIELQWHKLAIA
ncbi:MAG: antibiotic biosynthesis monooxygenase [Vagococcus sp.]